MARYEARKFTLKDGREVVLRHCTAEDASMMPAFMARVAAESTNTLQYVGREYAIARIARAWGDAQERSGSLYLGAFDGARMVGDLSIHLLSEDHPWIRHIAEFGMMVLEEFWGQGLGTLLLKEAESMMVSLGVTRIEAKVRAKNVRGLALYRKLGYEIEGTRKRAALINGEYQDEHFIAKLLK